MTRTSGFPTLDIANETQTVALARGLARLVAPGDVLALDGPLGAGKTALSRALIRALSHDDVDVPSPTFTLVQTYDVRGGDGGRLTLWHYDLYRLRAPRELDELGWDDALADGITVAEWPDNARDRLPGSALRVSIRPTGETSRVVTFAGDAAWASRLAGLALEPPEGPLEGDDGASPDDPVSEFLTAVGWGDAARQPLGGDASTRRYERLVAGPGDTALLMITPNPAVDITRFAEVAAVLNDAGGRAPQVWEADEARGLALVEDFGDTTFADLIDGGADPWPLHAMATDALITLHKAIGGDVRNPPCPQFPAFDTARFVDQVGLFSDAHLKLDAAAKADLAARWRAVLAPVCDVGPWSLILRDHHPGNLMRLPGEGVDGVGFIDFQDAGPGPVAYDLMSMLEDARRDVPDDLADAMIGRYLAAFPEMDVSEFRRSFVTLAAVRHARVFAIFIRLAREGGKPGYLVHLPRVRRLLTRALADPALSPVKEWLDTHAPGALTRLIPEETA